MYKQDLDITWSCYGFQFFTIEFYKEIMGNYHKMVIFLLFLSKKPYNVLIKLSLYNIIHLEHVPFLWTPNIVL